MNICVIYITYWKNGRPCQCQGNWPLKTLTYIEMSNRVYQICSFSKMLKGLYFQDVCDMFVPRIPILPTRKSFVQNKVLVYPAMSLKDSTSALLALASLCIAFALPMLGRSGPPKPACDQIGALVFHLWSKKADNLVTLLPCARNVTGTAKRWTQFRAIWAADISTVIDRLIALKSPLFCCPLAIICGESLCVMAWMSNFPRCSGRWRFNYLTIKREDNVEA